MCRPTDASLPWIIVCLGLFMALPQPAKAEPKLAAVFGDHMVLQRDQDLRVWGTGDAGATVEVSLASQTQNAKVDAHGRWQVRLKPIPAGGPHVLKVTSGRQTVELQDVLIGDVWLCSGQSNMQLPLREADDADEAGKTAAKMDTLRLLMVPKQPAGEPAGAFAAAWQPCTPESAQHISAVAFFFAEALRDSPEMAGVPIGLIDSSFGGTAAEAWISRPTLADRFAPEELLDSIFGIKPSQMYNGMVAPLVPMNLKGVLWYQGESNASKPELYDRMLATLIGEWRRDFQHADLPFLVVQLPNFPGWIGGTSFVWVREAQAKVAETVPHVYMAVIIDTPDGVDLHPKAKRMVGRRLALLARDHVYGEDGIVSSGPTLRRATVESGQIRLEFDTHGSKLTAKRGGDSVGGFTVAGEDGVDRVADARIVGDDEVIVGSDLVASPRTVRYAWGADPTAELYNAEGLPAAPFRTDGRPPQPLVELQPQPVVRRVSTPQYTATVGGDGIMTSLVIAGQQMLSNDGPGFMLAGWMGAPRQLFYVREIGPDTIEFSDRTVSVRYRFEPDRILIDVTNPAAEAVLARFLLPPQVQLPRSPSGSAAAELQRGDARLNIHGFESIKSAGAGAPHELHVSIPPGKNHRIELRTGHDR